MSPQAMHTFLLFLGLAACVLANTEVHLVKVPNHFNVPVSVEHKLDTSITQLNESSLLLTDHPIISIDRPDISNCKIQIPYDFLLKPKQRLFVKINNYGNSSYNSNDLLHVKFCWPATTPIDFCLGHAFLKNEVFVDSELQQMPLPSQLEIYITIDIELDFYALARIEEDSFEALLLITKLPNAIPIPLELYDFLLYAMDLLILTAVALPHLQKAFLKIVSSP